MYNYLINEITQLSYNVIKKPGIKLKITNDILSKNELIQLCSKQTIICFLYKRQHIYNAGLAAVTDQAIVAEIPLLVSDDVTFRHIHKYIDYYPNIKIKDAIKKTRNGVLHPLTF